MKIQHVPIEFVNQTWVHVEKFISDAVNNQVGENDFNLDEVRVYVTSGQWMLLVAVDEGSIKGAAVVNFFNRPRHRVAFVMYIGGRLVCNRETFKQLCDLLKAFGATKIEGAVNDAIARLWRRFGFTDKYRITEVNI
jgi:hypothetical protein